MLSDRNYMGRTPFGSRCPVTVAILWANAAFFILQKILKLAAFPIEDTLFLSWEGLSKGYLFQLISYQFLHAHGWHLFINVLCLYFVGREIERMLDRKEYLCLYFFSGIVGGLVQVGLAQILGRPDVSTVGASAASFGLLAAFAVMFARRPITFLLFFILPVTLPGKTFFWIAFVLSLYGVIFQEGSHMAYAAHLGGLCAGAGFVKFYLETGRRVQLSGFVPFLSPRKRPAPRFAKSRTVVVRTVVESKPRSVDFISQEIDPILDKISEHGIHSLTEREREILESARSKMGPKGRH